MLYLLPSIHQLHKLSSVSDVSGSALHTQITQEFTSLINRNYRNIVRSLWCECPLKAIITLFMHRGVDERVYTHRVCALSSRKREACTVFNSFLGSNKHFSLALWCTAVLYVWPQHLWCFNSACYSSWFLERTVIRSTAALMKPSSLSHTHTHTHSLSGTYTLLLLFHNSLCCLFNNVTYSVVILGKHK